MNDNDNALRTVMTADDQLDDIRRARNWSQIEARIGDAPKSFRRWWIGGGAVVALGAAAVIVIRLATSHTTPAIEAARTLDAPSGATLATTIGESAHIALVGPASLAVSAEGAASIVRIKRGTLLTSFDGGPGRSLRIEAPGAIVDVVGTLFSVEANAGATCVSVAHGRVKVAMDRGTIMLGDGERVCTDDGARRVIDEQVKTLLVEHERTVATTPVPAPASASAPASAPAPASASAPALALRGPIRTPAPATASPIPAPSSGSTVPDSAGASAATTPAATSPAATSLAAATPAATSPAAATPAATSPAANPPIAPPPATPQPATSPPVAPAPPTADELYHQADAARSRGDATAADQALAKLLTAYPSSALVDQALYDRARLAYDRRAWPDARAELAKLATIEHSPLAEPGEYLACRVALAAGDAGAAQCWIAYRAAHPHSPHDLDVLALIVQLAHSHGGCTAARAPLADLVRAYPHAPAATAWLARCPESK